MTHSSQKNITGSVVGFNDRKDQRNTDYSDHKMKKENNKHIKTKVKTFFLFLIQSNVTWIPFSSIFFFNFAFSVRARPQTKLFIKLHMKKCRVHFQFSAKSDGKKKNIHNIQNKCSSSKLTGTFGFERSKRISLCFDWPKKGVDWKRNRL